MSRELLVHVDLDGEPALCGRLWSRSAPREGATFEYDRGWLSDRRSFTLDPELPLSPGQFHTAHPLFRAFTDPAPDRWGQSLLRRAERARARREGRSPRTLAAIDFLTLVDDETRLGALRFRDRDGSAFLNSDGPRVPPVLALPRLLAATTRILEDRDTEDDLRLLLAPGTSLGGARPKATVLGAAGELLIAKFPAASDDWPVTRWEAAALALAQAAGIRASLAGLKIVARKPVLLVRRFDREGARRIPFMSGMTAAGADDGHPGSYFELAEALRRMGSKPQPDLAELWRRLAFNVLISNTDDHLRNHGFLHDGIGWRLTPAYDLNPVPADVRPRIHALAIDEGDADASLETALRVAPRFGLRLGEAQKIARSVGAAVKRWRLAAKQHGLGPREIERMESAFEHEDADRAGG